MDSDFEESVPGEEKTLEISIKCGKSSLRMVCFAYYSGNPFLCDCFAKTSNVAIFHIPWIVTSPLFDSIRCVKKVIL